MEIFFKVIFLMIILKYSFIIVILNCYIICFDFQMGVGGIINFIKFWFYDNSKVFIVVVDGIIILNDIEGKNIQILVDTFNVYE